MVLFRDQAHADCVSLLGDEVPCKLRTDGRVQTLEDFGHVPEVEGVVALLRSGQQLGRDGVKHLNRGIHDTLREPGQDREMTCDERQAVSYGGRTSDDGQRTTDDGCRVVDGG